LGLLSITKRVPSGSDSPSPAPAPALALGTKMEIGSHLGLLMVGMVTTRRVSAS
jgi:hypothetical protein